MHRSFSLKMMENICVKSVHREVTSVTKTQSIRENLIVEAEIAKSYDKDVPKSF